ncbi:MAG: hypothetical protein MUC50_17615 [Myxococcota bacterium]|jgi:hypothetical protein|nr:hypothetical protein [Myxococcota bacterium]
MATIKWDTEAAIVASEATQALYKQDKAELDARLQSGCVPGLVADTAQLRLGTAEVTSAKSVKVATRMTKDELIAGTAAVVMGAREALKRSRVEAAVKKAAGVGKSVQPGRASTARDAAKSMLDAYAANPDAFRAAGILPADMELLRSRYDALCLAEGDAVGKRVAAKLTVRQRKELQARVEAAVDHIIGVAQMAFVNKPDRAKLYRDLVPTAATSKKKKPVPA